jgi:hypothetical protein
MDFDLFAVVVVKFWSRRVGRRGKNAKTTMMDTHLVIRVGRGAVCPVDALCSVPCCYEMNNRLKTHNHYDLNPRRKTEVRLRRFFAAVSLGDLVHFEDYLKPAIPNSAA